jgi:hypothetical protein
LTICKASYYSTPDNDLVVSALSTFRPVEYQFASDVLLLSEGCEVRLVKNVNVAAGLANSVPGIVVKCVYNNADVSDLIHGKHPPPYCIIVRFPSFRGFLTSEGERTFPFSDHQGVPIFREKFSPCNVPPWIRKKQIVSRCYREQFPLDLSRQITAHRGQGQTWADRVVSVNMQLESPNNHVSPDIGSVLYVSLTRVNELSKLLVSPIFGSVWQKVGRSEQDETRRKNEATLKTSAEKFAIELGAYREFVEECSFIADASTGDEEWKTIVDARQPPTCAFESASPTVFVDRLLGSDDTTPAWMEPVASERHIGVDQGTKNFAMVAIDKHQGSLPRIVGAGLFDLRRPGLTDQRIDTNVFVLALSEETPFLSWMQKAGQPVTLPSVSRCIVHLEQISLKNK